MTDLTTKQLAEAIARAVRDAMGGHRHEVLAWGAEAVLDVLDANRVWFCKRRETDQGTTFEQMDLLR